MVTERRPQRRIAGRGAGWFGESRGLGRSPGRKSLHAAVDQARRALSRTGQLVPSWSPAAVAQSYDLVVLGDALVGWRLAAERASRGAKVAVMVPGRVGASPLTRRRVLFDQLRHDETGRLLTAAGVGWVEGAERAGALGDHCWRREPVVTVATSPSELVELDRLPLPQGASRSLGSGAVRAVVTDLDVAAAPGAVLEPLVPVLEAESILWHLAATAARAGVDIIEECSTHLIERVERTWRVQTDLGETRAGKVVDALADAALLRSAGVDLALLWQAEHRLVTEPVQPVLAGSLRVGGVLVSQSERGEIVLSRCGAAGQGSEVGLDLAAAAAMAAAVAEVVPGLAQLRVVTSTRQTELTGADGLPVVGEVDDGVWRIGGFCGNAGLELGLGEVVAAVMAGERPSVDLASWSPDRLRSPGTQSRTTLAEARG